MAQHETVLNFKGVKWDIEYYSDPEEAYIESIRIKEGEELIDNFTDEFIEDINTALLVQLEYEAGAQRAEYAAQAQAWRMRSENI